MKKLENIVNVIARRCFNTDVAISLIKECMNKESLFTRAACLMRLPRLRLAMTFPILTFAFILCLCLTGESRAACNGATATTAGTDEENKPCGTWDCGAQGSNVTCTLSKGTLTISGEGAMKNFANEATIPWADKTVIHAVVKGRVTTIGDRLFKNNPTLEDIVGTENITSIGQAAFLGTSLTSVFFPKVTYVNRSAFYGASNLEYASFAENVVFSTAYRGYPTFQDTKIPNCGTTGECGTCNGYIKSGTGCVTAENCGAGYYADEVSKRCIICPQDKVVYKGQCLDEYPFAKKKYTPAEAAQWLNEDNNTITLTFKKQ